MDRNSVKEIVREKGSYLVPLAAVAALVGISYDPNNSNLRFGGITDVSTDAQVIAESIGLEQILLEVSGNTRLRVDLHARTKNWNPTGYLIVKLGPFAAGQDTFAMYAEGDVSEDPVGFNGCVTYIALERFPSASERGTGNSYPALVFAYGSTDTLSPDFYSDPSDSTLVTVGRNLLGMADARLKSERWYVGALKLEKFFLFLERNTPTPRY